MDREPLKKLLNDISKFIYDDNLSPIEIASRVFKQTMLRDDYDDLVGDFGELSSLAEQASNLKIMNENSANVKNELEYLRTTFDWLSGKYSDDDEAIVGRRIYIFRFLDHEMKRGDYYLADSTLDLDYLGDLKEVFGDATARKLARLAGNMLDKEMSASSQQESAELLRKTIKNLQVAHDKLLSKQAKNYSPKKRQR